MTADIEMPDAAKEKAPPTKEPLKEPVKAPPAPVDPVAAVVDGTCRESLSPQRR